MASINEKLNYINETKSLIKDKLNNLGSEIEDETTFREYAEKIEDLYEAWPKINDEDTTISLDNTKKAKMNLQLKGNTYQYTTTGKNLWNNKIPNINQITWTPTDNGGKFTSLQYWKFLGNNLELDTTKQYTFSYSARNSDKLYYYIKTYTNNTYTTVKTTIVNDGTTLSKTFTPDSKYVAIYFSNGGQLRNVEIPNIQLELGDTITNFEPYTNGASPNSDYPQNIQIVTGENTITISNEANTENQTFSINLGSLELCKINNSQDYIYKNNNKWYKKPMILKIDSYNGETISTDYKSTTGSLTTGTTVYYINPESNPNGIQITDTTLITQLNILEQVMSYDNQTNISQENDNLPFIINASALLKNSN